MSNLSVYFVSDAHLGIEPPGSVPDRENIFISWLKSIRGTCSHLVILGDLFEFWYEYKHYITKHHFPLFRVLADLVDSGTSVYYLKGNHDFALESFFPENLGIQVCRELILELQGKRIFLTHGDGLPASDKGYRFLRRVLDFSLNRKLFRLIHPDIGMNLARFIGRHSRRIGNEREIKIDEYLEAGNRLMLKNHCDLLFHGHHHLQGIWEVSQGKIVSCGQWLFSLNYAEMKAGDIFLRTLSKK